VVKFDVDLSIVSHGHGALVLQALDSLCKALRGQNFKVRVLLTFNLPEPDLEIGLQQKQWSFALEVIRNKAPLGFGANHNQAFTRCQSKWFAVVNPDIFWPTGGEYFWLALQKDAWPQHVGAVFPRQHDVYGKQQDFTRKLMTPWGLLMRVWNRWRGLTAVGMAHSVEQADWVNGACMFFRAQTFAQLRGFDERYFMYCEDTDICLRLQLAGWSMQGVDWVVVHDARRNTGHSWRHLAWHLQSLSRLWCSVSFWRFVRRVR
jgi:N-acetylglucosaminyl-diphospho-decaprenol L-rhamnosyltransferase